MEGEGRREGGREGGREGEGEGKRKRFNCEMVVSGLHRVVEDEPQREGQPGEDIDGSKHYPHL